VFDNTDTLRHYERMRVLLAVALRTSSGYRQYPPECIRKTEQQAVAGEHWSIDWRRHTDWRLFH
jgi:DNA-binding transcriptional MerR regulator